MRSSGTIDRYEANRYSTVSPLRLRWMLLERACTVAQELETAWQATPPQERPEDSLLLRDLLGELLGGLSRNGGPVAEQLADLYVFLLQHLTRAEQTCNAVLIRDVGRVLEVERETWRQVVARHAAAPTVHSVGGAATSLSVHA